MLYHRQIISRRFVITGCDAAVFFQATKAPLNSVAIAAGITVEQ